MYHWFQGGWNFIKQALFPKLCLGCRQHGTYACPTCLTKLSFTKQLKCPNCHKPSLLGQFCAKCQKDTLYLNGLWPAQNYAHPLIKQLIKTFKYEGVWEINDILSQFLVATLFNYQLPPPWHQVPLTSWFITPIPLAKRKQRQRGFNQAELMARQLAQLTNLPFETTLIRQRPTPKQSRLTNYWRQTNLTEAFCLTDQAQPSGKIYILVDDVYTSGATLNAGAKVLKQAGALEVWGLTVAKG
ncbi:ComF family protein [Patescibacteria group bacterium]|nr:ComF family protein [Patescibacteria group bacterium]